MDKNKYIKGITTITILLTTTSGKRNIVRILTIVVHDYLIDKDEWIGDVIW